METAGFGPRGGFFGVALVVGFGGWSGSGLRCESGLS